MTHQDQKDEARHPEADIVPKSDSTILVKTYVTNLSAQETEQAVSLFSTSGQSVQFIYIFLIILSLCVCYNLYGFESKGRGDFKLVKSSSAESRSSPSCSRGTRACHRARAHGRCLENKLELS